MDLKQIFENNEKWISEKLSLNPNFFKTLAQGQHPEYLYIGCSDSRVTAEDIMGVQPGEVFVHRNIANQVISTDNNINAVVQYAVEHLKVKNIIVCGHYECGGVESAMRPSDMGQLNSWLQTLRDVYRLHKKELNAIIDDKKKLDRLVELNVREQCINVLKIDHVQKAWARTGYPILHAWVFDIRTGKLIDMNMNMRKEFSRISSIYDLKPGQDHDIL